MLRPHPKRPDWFWVGIDVAEPLFGVPGVALESSGKTVSLVAHRTHLPLLEHPDASKYLAAASTTADVWEQRNAWCAERGFTLRTTQQQALDFACYRRGVLLCDDMRLGKTLNAIMMDWQWRRAFEANNRHGEYGPLVIIAPLSTRAVWLGWLKRVFPDEEIGVITGKKFDADTLKKPIIFGHYDVIHKWQSLFDIGTVVFDEAHLLTNKDARRTLAATLLASKAKHAVALTGTPIYTFPVDLWSVLNLAIPSAWGSYFDFAQRYGAPEPTPHGTRYTGISHEEELRARLTEVMLRRRWRDCHSDLPPITRSVVVADLSQVERNKLDILSAKLKTEHSNTAANLAAYRRQVTAIKIDDVIREAEKVLDRGQPVVIWTWHKDFAERIAKKLGERGREALLLHGEVPIAERDRRMAAWKAAEKPAVLVANMAVAGAGIDLSHARIAIFAEIDYTPAMLGQAEMRTYAPDRPMDVIFIVADHFVDQRIVRALVAKLSASDPLGVGAAVDAIDALRDAVMGVEDDGDLDRLLEALLAG